MTNDQINALVAEKVLGWTKQEINDARWRGWSPSTDMNHAMETLGQFRYWDISGESGVKKPKILVTLSNTDGTPHRGTASTLPLAICVAALRAVGVEVDA